MDESNNPIRVNKLKSYEFHKGLTLVHNIPCILIPMNISLLLFEEIQKSSLLRNFFKSNCQNIAYMLGKEFIIFPYLPLNKKIQLFLDKLSDFGYGELKLIMINDKYVFIKNNNPNYYHLYSKIFNRNLNYPIVAEEILRAYLELIFQKKILLKIENKDKLRISFLITNNKLIKDISIIENNNNNINALFVHNKMLQKIALGREASLEKGNLKIWTVNLLALPLYLFEQEKEIKNILAEEIKTIGKAQGIIVSQFQKEIKGSLNKQIMIKNVIAESEFIGFGVIKNLLFDKENYNLSFEIDNVSLSSDNLIICYIQGLIDGLISTICEKRVDSVFDNKKYRVRVVNEKNEKNSKVKEYMKLLSLKISLNFFN